MKYTIAAILLFACITAYFSIYGERVPFDRTQNEGWVISGGDSGTPIPHEGGEGQMDAFVFVREMAEQETTQETTEETTEETTQKTTQETTEEAFPITVTVEQQKYTRQTWEYVIDGVAITLIVEIVILSAMAIVLWKKNKHP